MATSGFERREIRGDMAKFITKFESKKQDWETPDEIYLPLHKEFGFNLE